MKKSALLLIVPAFIVLFLSGCGSQQPMTEQQQADHFGYTLEEYRENKQAAARMNMTIEEHAKMLKEEEGMEMDGMKKDKMMDM